LFEAAVQQVVTEQALQRLISYNFTCKARNGKNPSTRVNSLAETAKRYFPPLAEFDI
jgi:hypothetical protein